MLPAARPAVFEVLTAADRVAHWWGPEGFTIRSLDFEATEGESYRIQMQPPEGDAFHVAGAFRAVDPPSRLAFTFAWEPPDPDDVENLVELALADRGESTEVRLRQEPFKTEARRELHRTGWSESFDKLERLVRA